MTAVIGEFPAKWEWLAIYSGTPISLTGHLLAMSEGLQGEMCGHRVCRA